MRFWSVFAIFIDCELLSFGFLFSLNTVRMTLKFRLTVSYGIAWQKLTLSKLLCKLLIT